VKILAKHVHATLGSELSAALESLQFTRIRGSTFAWSHAVSGQHLSVWAQCDKYGWEPEWGSTFALEFQVAPSPGIATGSIFQRQRLAHLLEPAELEAMRALNNEIIAQLPGSAAGSAVVVTEPDGFEVTIVGYRTASVPYSRGMDVWMHYHSVGHVMQWALWLRDLLPRLLLRATSLAAAS
jgi:hypothetical protein